MPRKKKASIDSSGGINEQREKAFMSVLDDINKKHGTGTILRMDDQPLTYPHIPSGSLGIDILLGIGGFPKGRITEIYGPAGGGKSTIALHAIRESMREAEYRYQLWLDTPEKDRGPEPNKDANVVYIDMESALNKSLAEMIGVDISKLYLVQPSAGEEALDVMEMAINSGVVDIVVLDSVAALVPRAEIEGEMGDSHVGLQARLMNQALRKIGPAVNKTKTVAIFINQIREKVGVMFGCFPYNAQVLLANKTTMSIGDIVSDKLDIEVMSFNNKTKRFEPKRINNWFNNGKADKFLRIHFNDDCLTCTANHMVLVDTLPDGEYKPAGELLTGENLLTFYKGSPYSKKITSIESISGLDNMDRFDLQIEDNHCYVVNDVVVHNSPETTPGGRGLPFYASVRLRVSRIQNIKEQGQIIGMRVKADVKKNKMAPPFGVTEYDLFFDSGISIENEILDIGADLGIVTKRGAFYYYTPPDAKKDDDNVLLGQGRTNAREFLMKNPDIRNYLYEEILKLQLPHLTINSDEEDDDEKSKKGKNKFELDEDEVLVEEVPEDE